MFSIITDKNTRYNENAVYCFYKEVTVTALCESSVRIFADARYKMYVNGVLVAVGPCRQTSETKYYDTVNITRYLQKGTNKIEIKVLQLSNDLYHRGEGLLVSVISSGHMGLCLWGNAGDQELSTDDTWLVAKEQGISFFHEAVFGLYNVAALYEKIDGACYQKYEFSNAADIQTVYDLEEEQTYSSLIEFPVAERTIPMMYFSKQAFLHIKNNVYDAGKETCGYVKLHCKGKGSVKVIYAECKSFVEDGKLIKRNRDDENGLVIGSYDIITVDGECEFEPFWMRTFRYIEIQTEGDVEISDFSYIETGYPIEVAKDYDFGNETDNKLFDISVNTLKRCMHETYMDCPYYEQLQYAMDTYLQIMYTYQLTDDKALPEKAIDDFAKSYRVGGLTQGRYPSNKIQYIPGFSLFFVLMLYEHSARFGDKAFLREYIHIADGVIQWFTKRLDGYLVKRSNLWDFIDWSEGYEKGQIRSKEPITVYSLMLAYTLDRMCEMHGMLGNQIPEYSMLSDKIKRAVRSKCFDEGIGLYADSPEKAHYSQHQQIWAVLCGMETEDGAKKLLEKSMNLTCKVTSAYMYFLFRALEKAQMYAFTEEYIDSLRSLVALGCTTTPEWVGEDVRSECHAWSAVAIYEFTAKVLGVTYQNDAIKIAPYIVGRTSAKGSVATPVGMVYCEWSVTDATLSVNVRLPHNQTAILTMPDGTITEVTDGVYTCDIQQ